MIKKSMHMYQKRLLRKHLNENALDIKSADRKTMFAYAKLPINRVEKNLNKSILLTCIILSVSRNKGQMFLASTKISSSFAENSVPLMAKLASFGEIDT